MDSENATFFPEGTAASIAPTETVALSVLKARFGRVWQELWSLPADISDQRHQAMLVMFDRLSAAAYGTKPLYKEPTILDALRNFDAGRAAMTGAIPLTTDAAAAAEAELVRLLADTSETLKTTPDEEWGAVQAQWWAYHKALLTAEPRTAFQAAVILRRVLCRHCGIPSGDNDMNLPAITRVAGFLADIATTENEHDRQHPTGATRSPCPFHPRPASGLVAEVGHHRVPEFRLQHPGFQ